MPTPPLTRRLRNVIVLHVANPWPTLITPWLIFLAVFALNVGVWAVVTINVGERNRLDPDAFSNNGGVAWIFFYFAIIAIQAMNLTFSFALGLGVTRRDYYLGTAMYLIGLAVALAVIVTVGAALEAATDGWWIEGRFFAPGGLDSEPLLGLLGTAFFIALLFMFVGAFAGAVWVRWRVVGIYVFIGGFVAVILAALWIVGRMGAWQELGDYLSTSTILEISAWTAPLTVLCAVGGYLTLRRASVRA